ncbi:MAG: hypothetical protein JWM74_4227, partial [Myxococcaceae bacterium]|nr:hypothetical protein [Myxococcaceae bacterium]
DAGGTIVFEGEPKLLEKKKTATGRALGAIAAAARAARSSAGEMRPAAGPSIV